MIAAREAFNRIAEFVDEVPRRNATVAWMRARCRGEIIRAMAPSVSLLEIGCGSGADAVYMARQGHPVVAVDLSDRMVDLARQRVHSAGLEQSVVILRGRLSELLQELESSSRSPFGGAYANFSLTYEDSLETIGRLVHRVLDRTGWFVFTVPNRLCLAAALLAGGRFRPRAALARLRSYESRRLSGVTVQIRSYTPPEVRRQLKGLFRLDGMVGIPSFAPPPGYYRPDLESYLLPLRSLDDRFCASFPWSVIGDHTLYRCQKIPR